MWRLALASILRSSATAADGLLPLRITPIRISHLHDSLNVKIAGFSSISPPLLPTFCIWGANTNVGKTVISAGLAAAVHHSQVDLLYLKPVQTGFPRDSDARLVARVCASSPSGTSVDLVSTVTSSSETHSSPAGHARFKCQTLHAWHTPVSPHMAAEQEGWVVSDDAIIAGLRRELSEFAGGLGHGGTGVALVETAGGVCSPGPSLTLQCDLLRPLRLPAVLVGDARLGGISATLTAWESLLLRGYDVAAVVLMQAEGADLGNLAAIEAAVQRSSRAMGRSTPVMAVPHCPAPAAHQMPSRPGDLDGALLDWVAKSRGHFDELLRVLLSGHNARLQSLSEAAKKAERSVWWPFTQHANLPRDSIQVVDARAGENWLVYKQEQGPEPGGTAEQPVPGGGRQFVDLYDASCSWWTQAANAHLQPEVVKALAHAAGRYMHVLYPQVVHEPALEATQLLLQGVGNGWASRVFFSDDGSTAIEVAVKMAFRKFAQDHGLGEPELAPGGRQLHVLGLRNAYHGDTLGAMDCAPPSPFNGWPQAPWYTGRGLFLDPPYISMVQGMWRLAPPAWLQEPEGSCVGLLPQWTHLDDVFDDSNRAQSLLAACYRRHIEGAIDAHQAAGDLQVAACVMEPVLQGAGGMLIVDPLFQQVLSKVCRQRRIPVVFDEVFTGLWRIGWRSGAALLGVTPDIACYAKLLTGGTVPLAATLTTESVFEAFQGSSRLHALLHGHSYTAHPIGCAAAAATLRLLSDPATSPNLCHPGQGGGCTREQRCARPCGRLLDMWDADAVRQLSHHLLVRHVVALGTVLAVDVRQDTAGAGHAYASAAPLEVVRRLRSSGVFVRPLGSVVYLMVTPTTDRGTARHLQAQLLAALDAAATSGAQQSAPPEGLAAVV